MHLNTWQKIVVLLLIAFVVRLAVGVVWQAKLDRAGQRFGMGDSDGYWQLGRTIALGQPYAYGESRMRVFRTPGYPALLAPIIRWAGDDASALLLARAEAALFGVLAVLAVWWLARLLFDDRVALWAAIFATFYPGAIFLSVLLLSEAPFCPLMLLQLALWTLAWRSTTRRRLVVWSVLAGVAAGAATLMRPSWLMFTPMAVAVGVFGSVVFREQRLELRRHLAVGFWMLLGLAAAMSPWWIRNACVVGRFVPTTLQVGASLYDGLSPEAAGGSAMAFVKRFETEDAATHPGKSPGASTADAVSREVRLDRRMRDASLDWAKANPGEVLRLAGVKFLRLWNFWPNEPQFAANWLLGAAIFFTYTPLLVFAIIGVWKTIGKGWPYILCWLPAVYLTLLHTLFVSSLRYREPAMLALLALAAGAVAGKNRNVKKE
jgi:4-amino-4-deoxy-L-arabinose transferase-like glycosyltransferase